MLTPSEIKALWGCNPGDVVHAKVGDAVVCGVADMVAIGEVGEYIVKVRWLDSGQNLADCWFPRDRVKLRAK